MNAHPGDTTVSLLLQYLPAGVVVHAPDTQIILANEGAAALLGLTLDELMGKTATDKTWSFVREDASPLPLDEYPVYRILSSGQPVRDMAIGINRAVSGDRIWVQVNAYPEWTDSGGLDRIVVVMTDITARIRTEQTLRESEQRFARTFHTNPLAQIVTSFPEGRVVEVNTAYCAMMGYQRDELIGHTTRELEFWADPHERDIAFAAYARDGHIRDREISFKVRSGEVRSMIASVEPIQFGGLECAISTMMDITDRKRAEEELRQLNAELERRIAERTAELTDLYNNAPCAYHSIDSTGMIVHINDTELRWLGYEREEVVGKKRIVEFLTPSSVEFFRHTFPNFVAQGRQLNIEVELLRKDGTSFPVLLNATAVYDNDGRFIMSRSTMIDYTERKQALARLVEAQNNLEMSNRELEAFSYTVSHDLRAPLRAIDGFTRILLDEYGANFDAEQRRLFSIVCNNAQKMDRLITDLLSLSRLSRVKLRIVRIDMGTFVREVFDELAGHPSKAHITLEVGELPEAFADPVLLRQVWSNLLSNAVKYSSLKSEAHIHVGSRNEEHDVVYYVQDNGVGFDPRYADKLFGIFQRLHSDEQFQGTGVGLAIVQRIITRHGGRVWADGRLNEGATFYFSLPRVLAIPDDINP